MAVTNPTFAGTILFVSGSRMRKAPADPRHVRETMPGVDGEFFQTFGTAGQTFMLMGRLQTLAAGVADWEDTPEDAMISYEAALTTRQGWVEAGTVGTFIDHAGTNHTNCVVMAYDEGQRYTASRPSNTGGTEYAICSDCRAVIRNLSP